MDNTGRLRYRIQDLDPQHLTLPYLFDGRAVPAGAARCRVCRDERLALASTPVIA